VDDYFVFCLQTKFAAHQFLLYNNTVTHVYLLITVSVTGNHGIIIYLKKLGLPRLSTIGSNISSIYEIVYS